MPTTTNSWEHRARAHKVFQYQRAFNQTFKRHGFDPLEKPQEFAQALANLPVDFWNKFGVLHGLRPASETTRGLIIAGYMALKPSAKTTIETTGEELPAAECA